MEKITQGHPLTQSPDLIQENIKLLKSLFPTIAKEGKIDFTELKALLDDNVESEEEFYRFTWAGKSMARNEANKPSTATLRPRKDESKNWDTTKNIFIEGENLEVLKVIQKSYSNKIRLIYIDPPYNTGNDFVYKDDYKDNLGNYLAITNQLDIEGKRKSTNPESDGRYHSNWLNMMYPRIKIAQNLMADNSIIVISIDDKEVHNLRKICDEIFGEDCFMGQISRATGTPTGGGNEAIVNKLDYLLVYSRHGNNNIQGLSMSVEESRIYDKEDENGKYLTRSLRRTGGEDRREDRPSMYFPIYSPDGTPIFPTGPTGYQSRWICGKEKVEELNKEGLLEWKNIDGVWQVYQKYYLEGRLKQPSNLWDDIEGNKKATRDLKSLFDDVKIFDFPKPVELIKKIIKLSSPDEHNIVLDFFAGSCTTAQAVMELNAQDNSTIKYICVQIPEQTDEKSDAFKAGYKIITEIGKERIRRSGEIILNEKKEYLSQLKLEIKGKLIQDDLLLEAKEVEKTIESLDFGFKVFKLDSSNIVTWDSNPDNLEQNLFNAASNIKENRKEEDILYEILLKYGLDLTIPIENRNVANSRIYNIGSGSLFICLGDELTTKVAEEIGKWKNEINPATSKVIFKDSGFTDIEKTNCMQILKRFGIEEVNTI